MSRICRSRAVYSPPTIVFFVQFRLNAIVSFLIVPCAAAIFFATPVRAQERKTLQGQVPAVVARLTPVDRLPGAKRLDLAIGLPLRNKEELDNLLHRIYDPTSTNYRQYLTPEQFTDKFGPTEQDYQKVIAFVESNGLKVTGTHPNRMLVDVSGPVADIEKAFHVTLRVYPHPKESRTFYAPDTEPSVDASVPVLDISGLNNYVVPRPKYLKAAPGINAAKAGSGPNGLGYMGNDFRAAYIPGVTNTGAGQSVGLVEFDGYYANDIYMYETNAHLPTTILITNVLLNGFDGSAGGGNIEVALDIEMAISMAPGLSSVIVYEEDYPPNATIANDLFNRMATDNLAKQLSCSWIVPIDATSDQIFQEYAVQGQSFFDASGDDGAYIGTIPPPSDDPYMTQVGGTTLTTSGPGGSWVSETTWNWGGGTSSSGGVSPYYPIPGWQQGIDMSGTKGSTTMRNFPDVAMVADQIFVVADDRQLESLGGTSAAAPLWAGFLALVNQQAAAAGKPTVGFINPAVYAIGMESGYKSDFHDITTGNNANYIGVAVSEFFAVPGYDLCTGLGTPTGSNLITALLAPPDALGIKPAIAFAASGPVGGPFNITSQNYSLTNAGVSSLNWTNFKTATWLNVSASGGTLTPGGAATNVTVSLNSAASNLVAGIYDASVWFTNLSSHVGQSRSFTLQAGQPLVQNGGFETGDFSCWLLTGDNGTYDFVDDGSVPGIAPHSGTYYLAAGQVGLPLATVSQVLPTAAGQPYLLSFWLDSPDGHTPNEFRVAWDGNTIFDQVDMPASGWTNLQFAVTATGTSTVLQFGFRDDPSYLGLDDTSLVPISAPSFQTVAKTNGAIKFTWSTMTGLKYQVQYKTNLTQTKWVDLGGVSNATSSTLTMSDSLNSSSQRFYRILLLP